MLKKLFTLLLFVFALTLTACDKKTEVEYPKTYSNVTVIAGEETDAGVVMTIEADGFHGKVTADVTVKDGKIVAFVVTAHTESVGWGKALIDEGDFIQALIDSTNSLDTFDISAHLDSEAGATFTGEALLDIAKTALAHYNEDYKK